MPKLNFASERDGWHFENRFENRILPGILHGVSTKGLCGGMLMTALDYWRAGIPVPMHDATDLPPDSNGNRLPAEASACRRYIFDRQMDSLLTRLMFTRWITAPTITPNDFHNWAIGPELRVVQQQIGLNRPAMLGLWSMTPGNPTGGHQVLCYGWDVNPVRLYLYDPNNPDEETVLTPESPALGCRVRGAKSGRESFYRGYFFTDVYDWNETPPHVPRYRDLALTAGLSTTPPGPDADVGTRLALTTTVQNIGEYPSRFRSFCIWARDPAGRNIDSSVGGIEAGFNVLNPGQSRVIARTVSKFGTSAGIHSLGVSAESQHGHWQNVAPIGSQAVSVRQLRLFGLKQKRPDVWVNVPESSRADIDTGVVLMPGDEYALTGSGAIWAGVWLTGLNGPEGWTDRIETNPNSPYHNRPDARPFSLLARVEGEGYRYIGRGVRRAAYNRGTQARLFVRINDNTPANGSGAFQCLVEVWR